MPSTRGQTDPPVVSNTNAGIRIRHREYITDVQGTEQFVNVAYNLNPGLVATFPWLSTVASCFQEYKFHGCVFEFISNCSDQMSSSSPAQGSVILSTDYNAAHQDYSTKLEMENAEFTTSGKPAVNILHLVETASKQTVAGGHLYIRTGAPEANTDIRLYDLGKFQIATDGMQSNFKVGQLHVSYDVEFFKPELPDAVPQQLVAHYKFGAVNQANPWNAPGEIIDSIGLTFNGSQVIFPTGTQGKFMMSLFMKAGTVVAPTYPAAVPTNIVLNADVSMTSAAYYVSPQLTTTSTQHTWNWVDLDVNASSAPATLKWCPYAVADMDMELIVVQLPSTFT